MTLVALCLVVVLWAVLASYLTLCSRVMSLSNRGFQRDLGRQLAEAGIEEALRAFNKNDWSDWSGADMSVDWSLDATNKRATATISFSSGKFAQGTTAAIKVRVDNYDAHVLGAGWDTGKTYRLYDVVGYNGAWYSCLLDHTSDSSNEPPNLSYWAEAPIPWRWSSDITYKGSRYQLVNYDGVWYRYISSSASSSTTNLSDPRYWRAIPSGLPMSTAWVSGSTYYFNSVVGHGGKSYLCTNSGGLSGISTAPDADVANWVEISHGVSWQSLTSYADGNLVRYDDKWYYCSTAHTSTSSFDASKWTQVTALSLTWATNTGYARGSIVFEDGDWYYCTTAHMSGTFSTDLSDGKWVDMGNPSDTWNSGTDYHVGDYAYDSGAWYRCLTEDTASVTPPNSSANWTNSISLPHPYISWMYRAANPFYEFNELVYYSTSGTGTWYRRDIHNTATWPLPTNTSYWENALSDSWDWDSGDDYNIGDVVHLSGSFYRCIRAHTTSQTPPNSTYWSTEPSFSSYWDENKNYGIHDVVRYRGSWYLNLTGTSTRPGTDNDNWAIAPGAVTLWSSSKTYHVDDVVSSGGNWYRCKEDHSNQAVGSDNTYWVQLAGPAYAWSPSTAYSAGSYVSYGGVWYKCLATTTANAGHSPNRTTYWTPAWAQSAGVTTGAPVLYAESEITLGDRTTSLTQLRATLDHAPLFPNAAGATTSLTISSGAGTVDSYDSELPDSSDTDGDNYVAANAGYTAVLAAGTGSSSGTSTLLSVGGSTIVKGYAAAVPSSTSPYAPRASYGSSVTVHGATSSVSPNIDTAQVSRSPYIPQFDIQTPIQQTSIPTSLPSTTYAMNLGTPGAPTPSVYYFSSSLNIASGETVNINGPVILRINGYLLANTGTFKVNSTGSVVVYFPYVVRSYSGAGGFQNLTKDPKKMLFINTSTTSPSTATYFVAPSSSPEFYGAIYMPNVTATLGLDIRTGNEIFGALSAREITFSSEANLHYDTSLRYATFSGVDQPYTVTTWSELAATEQATMP